jgi:hypothetical protein
MYREFEGKCRSGQDLDFIGVAGLGVVAGGGSPSAQKQPANGPEKGAPRLFGLNHGERDERD